MRLKTLEIKGFKSFADKTILHFDKGVTGVIGPNGCGKSNIIDSIRWAIGEHKTSALRSEKMSGLIFNGSKARPASGLAEVSLTFENTKNILPTEFSTITINRKYFKNGDSEFRLNDVTCRLKDINNLFLDTGVSTDTYAIIELGMVDDIIKDKDQSRRRMLEQAAGISIYKTRKKEAQTKLSATEQDLDRIEDLLFEIQGNLKTLESQARKAERYYKLKKVYKDASIELAKASMEGFNDTFKELSDKQREQEDKKTEIDTGITKSDAEIEALKLSFTEKEKELQELQAAFNKLIEKIRREESEKRLADQRLQYSKSQEAQITEFLEGTDERLESLKEELTRQEQRRRQEQEKLTAYEKALQELKEVREKARLVFNEKKENREQNRRAQQRLQQSQFDIEKKIAVGETSIQNLKQSITRLENESRDHGKNIEEQETLRKKLEEELGQKKELSAQLSKAFEETKNHILKTQSAIEKLRLELMDKNRKLDARRNEYNLLKSMVDNLEGYPDSLKFLKKSKEWEANAVVLSDIIAAKEEFRPAIEGLLEPYLNYYVVEKMEDALLAVQLLDKNKKGKANFFLLENFKNRNSKPALQEEGLIPALEVVEVEDKYRELVRYLLGNVVITEHLEEADGLLKKNPETVIVEKDGKLNRTYYRLSGGSVGLFEGNKLGRSKNLKKLKGVIDELEKETTVVKEKIGREQNALSELNKNLNGKEIERSRDEINRLQNQLYGIKNKIENLNTLHESNKSRLEEYGQRLGKTEAEIASLRGGLADFDKKKEMVLKELEQSEQAFLEADHRFNEVGNKFNEQNLEYTRQQSLVRSVAQDTEFKSSRLKDLENQIMSNKVKLEKTKEEMASTFGAIEKASGMLKDLAIKREADQKILNEKDQDYDNVRNKVGEMEKNLRTLQKDRSLVEDGLSGLKEKLNELKLHLAGMKERLNIEFGINLEDILEEAREGEEREEVLREQVEKYKNRLHNMGEINPTAIDAFQEMKKRFDFISGQRDDLVRARESLVSTIREVETTANEKFLDTFSKVKENFIRVFKTLFTEEDEADMLLSDPENLSETGIEIIAKPKGKRPTAITQLSGGEKTLTAIALLFAIYLIKPAPFCILDEVDAPLDDVNIDKFTGMIRKFSENSQFIVITHNKQTMAAVDVIYGVTMQEAGVSKLVPVDFRNLN